MHIYQFFDSFSKNSFADIRHPEELSLLVLPKSLRNDKSQAAKAPKHQHTNGTQEDGLLTPNVLTPGLTPMSPYTPGWS